MKLICNNKCKSKQEFNILTREVGMLRQVYIKCKMCGTEYYSYYENYESLKVQDKINSAKIELANIPGLERKAEPDEAKLLMEQRQSKLDEIKNLTKKKKEILLKINKKDDEKN
jgi:hypothetical protein